MEYVGGYRDYHIEYDYDAVEDEGIKVIGPGGKVMGKGGDRKSVSGKSGKKLQFSASEPTMKSGTALSETTSGAQSQGKEASGAGSTSAAKSGIMKPGSPTHSENLAYVDTLDRKT